MDTAALISESGFRRRLIRGTYPTKEGIALRFKEWRDLCTLITTINNSFPCLASAQPCYYDDDHMNQLGWMQCTECHPFLVQLSQATVSTEKTICCLHCNFRQSISLRFIFILRFVYILRVFI